MNRGSGRRGRPPAPAGRRPNRTRHRRTRRRPWSDSAPLPAATVGAAPPAALRAISLWVSAAGLRRATGRRCDRTAVAGGGVGGGRSVPGARGRAGSRAWSTGRAALWGAAGGRGRVAGRRGRAAGALAGESCCSAACRSVGRALDGKGRAPLCCCRIGCSTSTSPAGIAEADGVDRARTGTSVRVSPSRIGADDAAGALAALVSTGARISGAREGLASGGPRDRSAGGRGQSHRPAICPTRSSRFCRDGLRMPQPAGHAPHTPQGANATRAA